eukprot:SAG31_NODE_217_length_19988_cov_53.300820_15_plen_329_part_00
MAVRAAHLSAPFYRLVWVGFDWFGCFPLPLPLPLPLGACAALRRLCTHAADRSALSASAPLFLPHTGGRAFFVPSCAFWARDVHFLPNRSRRECATPRRWRDHALSAPPTRASASFVTHCLCLRSRRRSQGTGVLEEAQRLAMERAPDESPVPRSRCDVPRTTQIWGSASPMISNSYGVPGFAIRDGAGAHASKLQRIYEDADGARRAELVALSGGNRPEVQFKAFNEKLREVQGYYRKFPPTAPLQPAGQEGGEDESYELPPEPVWSGEEFWGRYLDLHVHHERWLNLPGNTPTDGSSPLTYADYTDTFGDFECVIQSSRCTILFLY